MPRHGNRFLLLLLLIWLCSLICGCSSAREGSLSTNNKLEPQVLNIERDAEFDPLGYAGAKWGMTYDQVKSVVGPGGSTDDGGYIQLRDVYGRKAHVNYNFNEGRLNIIIITFLESYDKNQTDLLLRKNMYSQTQHSLAYDYGVFLVAPEKDEIINNKVWLQETTIEHVLDYRNVNDVQYMVEQILVYKST